MSDPQHRQHRRFRVEWIALGATLAIIAAIFAWTLGREQADIGARERDRLQTQAKVVDDNVTRQLEGADKALEGVRAQLQTSSSSSTSTSDSAAQATNKTLTLLTASMPGVSTMLLLDADGTIVAASRPDLLGKNFKQRDYFDVPRRGADANALYVSPPFMSSLGTFVMVVSKVVTNAQGGFAGVVTATLDPAYFSVILSSVLYAPDMQTTLIHGDGRIFLSMPARNGEASSDDDDRLIALRSIDRKDLRMDKPMAVAVSRDRSAVYQSWDSKALRLLAFFCVLALVTTAALYFNQHRRREVADAAAAVLRERQSGAERVELALRGADLGLWDMHVPTNRLVVNARERALLGFAADDPLPQGASWRELIHPDDRARVDASILPHLRGEAATYECEHRMRHRAGHYIWLFNRAMIVERDERGGAVRIVGTHLDITARQEAQMRHKLSEERLSLALESSGLALFDWDIFGRRLFQSAQAAAMRGAEPMEMTIEAGESQQLIHPDDRPRVLERNREVLKGIASVYDVEFRLRRVSGDWLWVRARGRVVERDAEGRALRLAGTYANINERKAAEGRLRRLAEFDTLTDLPNRALFHDRLQQAMRRAARGKPMALLFLDVDRFKSINDTLGHEAGDQLLKEYAARMQGAIRQSDTVARLAGDEFTIILEALNGRSDACMLAQKIVDVLRAPITLGGESMKVTASIGVAMCCLGELDDAALLRRADAALYEAKRRGRDGYYCEESDLDELPQADPLAAASAPKAFTPSA